MLSPALRSLAILAVAILHDAGILGSMAFAAGFLILLRGLWGMARTAQNTMEPTTTGRVAAFMAAIAAMLVAYQVTNAIHFGSNWMLIGAAVAAMSQGRPESFGSGGIQPRIRR